jgi:hypothetical protein
MADMTESDGVRAGYINAGKAIFFLSENVIQGAKLFHSLQLYLSLILIAFLTYKLTENIILVILSILFTGLWVAHTVFSLFGIDSFVFLQALVTIVLGYLLFDQGTENRNSKLVFAVWGFILPVFIGLSKPLTIFVYGGFLLLSVLLWIFSDTNSNSDKSKHLLLASTLGTSVIFISMLLSSSETQSASFTSTLVHYSKSVIQSSSPFESLIEPLMLFRSSTIDPLFGNLYIFFIPIVLLSLLFIVSRNALALMFLCLFVSHIPMVLILGLSGLRSTQAATLVASWICAIVIIISLVWTAIKGNMIIKVVALSSLSILMLSLPFYSGVFDKGRFSPNKISSFNAEHYSQVCREIESIRGGRVYYDYVWGSDIEILKSFYLDKKVKRKYRPFYKGYSKNLMDGVPEPKLSEGDLVIHRWVHCKQLNRYKNLLYVRDHNPRLKLFIISFKKSAEYNISPRPGDIFLISKRWRKAVLPLLSHRYKIREERPGMFKVLKKRNSRTNTVLLHPNLVRTMRQNDSFNYGELKNYSNNPIRIIGTHAKGRYHILKKGGNVNYR